MAENVKIKPSNGEIFFYKASQNWESGSALGGAHTITGSRASPSSYATFMRRYGISWELPPIG
jgi:hypothetical protein